MVVGAAHQFPTGTTLSERRRRELVSWARRGGGLIIEDDYDAEFRYDRDPVASVQGTAPDVTALLGSVSKTLAPGLGIGWMLAPRDLSEAVRRQAHPVPSTVDQLAFAHLLRSGGYDRHLRSVRRELARRRAALLGSLTEHLPDAEVSGAEAGLHLLVRLPGGVSAAEVHQRAGQLGLRLARLADYQVHPVDDSCLVLGYGNLGTAAVSSAIEALAGSVRDLRA